MDFEVFFLIMASLLLLLDITLLSTTKLTAKRKKECAFSAAFLTFALIILSYAMLLQAFVNNDFSFVGVYSSSSSSASLLSKIYSSWAGAGGSMLFLTVLLSIFYLALRILAFKNPNKLNVITCQVFGVVLFVFIIICLLRNPFERFPVSPAEGIGLNPQLQSVWMAIHPPIVFSAYAFAVLAFALTIASIKTDRELDDSKLFKASTYAAWLLLTIGIALGGLWAYEVLGWGGYWAWDPVETASLLPWIFLVAYFAVKNISDSKKSLTRELMIMITFASLVFLSALTRGGLTQSVHSYAVSAIGPIMLTFAVGMVVYFFYVAKSKRKPLFQLNIDRASLSSRSSYLGFWALILIAVVCLVGLAFPGFAYNYWTYPFVVLFIVALIGYSFNEKTHYARQLLIVAVSLVAGVAISMTGLASVNILVTLTIPLLLVAFFCLIYKLTKTIRRRSLLGQTIFGLAVIVLLLGVFMSAGAKTIVTLNDVKINAPQKAMQFDIVVTGIYIENSAAQVYNSQANVVIPEYSIIKADVTMHDSDRTYQGSLSASLYPNYGLVIKPLIITTETGDLYVHIEFTDSLYNNLKQASSGNSVAPNEVAISVQNSSLIYLVWLGVVLMAIAISIQFASDLSSQKERCS
jgi:cytochrome c-type biogenesis protein CcmF